MGETKDKTKKPTISFSDKSHAFKFSLIAIWLFHSFENKVNRHGTWRSNWL